VFEILKVEGIITFNKVGGISNFDTGIQYLFITVYTIFSEIAYNTRFR